MLHGVYGRRDISGEFGWAEVEAGVCGLVIDGPTGDVLAGDAVAALVPPASVKQRAVVGNGLDAVGVSDVLAQLTGIAEGPRGGDAIGDGVVAVVLEARLRMDADVNGGVIALVLCDCHADESGGVDREEMKVIQPHDGGLYESACRSFCRQRESCGRRAIAMLAITG